MPEYQSAARAASPDSPADPHAVLGVPRGADAKTLARAYRRAARRAHPDTGGSAEAFAAVQAAWAVLSSDRPEPIDPWALGDWGVATRSDTTPQPHASPGPTKQDFDVPEDEPWGQSFSDGDGDYPAPSPDAHRYPFAPGAVRLPAPTLPTPRPSTLPRRGPLDRVLECAMVGAAATTIGAITFAGSRIPGTAYILVGAWLALLGLGVIIGHSRGAGGVFAWALVALMVTGSVAEGSRELGGAATRALLVGSAILCAATTWWEYRRVRRSRPRRTRMQDAARMGPALMRHHLACRWNDARNALATAPGSTVERIVESGFQDPARRWMCIDAVTGSMTIRDLGGAELEPNSWVVLDAAGAVLAVAPAEAPRAWAAVVRETPASARASHG